MPRFIKLTNLDGVVSRVAVSAIAHYVKHRFRPGTTVTLTTVHEGQSEYLTVQESEDQIDALIAGEPAPSSWRDVSRDLDAAIAELDRNVAALQAARREVTA